MSTIFWQFLKFLLFISFCSAHISDKRLCVDPECKSPISVAKTLRTYYSPDEYRLSFGPNEDVVIFSKSAGSNENLWGAEIKGKRGYIPKNLVRETKIYNKPNLLVDTEINSLNKAKVPSDIEVLSPSKVKQNFEVIDGTTVYMDERIENGTEASNNLEENSNSSNESVVENSETAEEVTVSENLTTNTNITTEAGKIDMEINENEVKTEMDNSFGNGVELGTEMGMNTSTEHSVTIESNETIDSKIVEIQNEEEIVANVSIQMEETENNLKSIQEHTQEDNNVANLNDPDSKANSLDKVLKNQEFESKTLNNQEFEPKTQKESLTDSDVSSNSNDSSSLDNLQTEPIKVSSDSKSNYDLKFLKPEIDVQQNSQFIKDESELSSTLEKEDVQKISEDQFTDISTDVDDSIAKVPIIEKSENNNSSNSNNEDSLVKEFVPVINVSLEGDVKSSDFPIQANVSEEIADTNNNNENDAKEIIPPSEGNLQNESIDESFTINKDIDQTKVISEEYELQSHNENMETTPNSDNNPHSELDVSKENFPEENNPQNENIEKQHNNAYSSVSSDNDISVTDDQQTHNINTYNSKYSQDEIEENKKFIEKNTNLFSYFNGEQEQQLPPKEESSQILPFSTALNNDEQIVEESVDGTKFSQNDEFCTKESCPKQDISEESWNTLLLMDMLSFNSDIFVFLVTTAVSVLIFLLGHFALDKSRRERPLIVKINKLEKEFLILLKEKELLSEQLENKIQQNQCIENEEFSNSQQEKESLRERVQLLEEQVQSLEKELENSTEVGLELNRMLSEVLNSEDAGQTLMLNIEGLQAQLAEQQNIVSDMKEVLSLKETENHEIKLELDIANKKVADLQSEVDKLLLNMIKLDEDKEALRRDKESKLSETNKIIDTLQKELKEKDIETSEKIEKLRNELSATEHNLQLKIKEYEGLKKTMQQIKEMKNANTLESLLEVNSIKAELEQIKVDCQSHCDRLQKEKEANCILEKKIKLAEEQVHVFRTKFDEADKAKLELETKLQVLTNYFKDREEQLQKEISKYEDLWSTKQGEATSTSERIKYLQSEVQNYKSQNETLKQEIVSQEVELKGQISVLEKKVHENWVSARQAERRLEELKQEAAQLRNRLTLRERALQEDRLHNRMQSPLEQNEDIPISPMHLESPASPPPLYNSREHVTKSPPILGMPPPFLPPPPSGAPFLPPPPLPFMAPPPHDMFPGDHRPPPLGRMSSPPLNTRYSPNRGYSPYDRSPSPSYDESEYGTSPVHRRNFSQYNRRRDHRSAAMEKFNGRSGTLSSGSDNSNESLEEMNRQNSKV